MGLPHAITVTTADVTDRTGAIDMVEYYGDVVEDLSALKMILVDGCYTGNICKHGQGPF